MQEKIIADEELECNGRYIALRKLGIRSSFLFVDFFLIVTAYYQLKPASRSLFLEAMGARQLPYVWILTAVATVIFISFYNRMVRRYTRINVVMGTCMVIGILLVVYRFVLNSPGPASAIGFYVFVDIIGVVLIEQFWSLANAIYTTQEGKSWYGFVGTGGLVGGVAGGGIAAFLISRTSLETPDLLLTASATIMVVFLLTWIMGRMGIYCESASVNFMKSKDSNRLGKLMDNHYLVLIGGILLLAQLASPLIEYQFLSTIEKAFPETEVRTAYLSAFFSVLSLVSIGVNLGITPLVHRRFGTIHGLLVQPLLISFCSLFFMIMPSDFLISATKISDRGLSYSINRASKELLYVPIDPVLIYQAKAWLDMLGYRLFKVFGSFLILLVTQWLPVSVGIVNLSWLTLFLCGVWIFLVMALRREYKDMVKNEI
ncbi:MAG: Npt1/Npt2 family nucleotide transporter [Deltaproteobacteria bacterium]|nr:Npt1/Npt2 family nucleotide transporter [Deltaproteobacteria bacterium]